MNQVFLSLGSNLGNRILNLENAISDISKNIGKINATGRLYETEPWGFNSENWFVNTAIELETKLNPYELLNKCLWIEKKLGRKRTETEHAYNSRPIDIDILFFNKEMINSSILIIPHEHLHKRKFVLAPLNDIASGFVHPAINKTVANLLQKCDDKMKLKILV